MNMECGFPSVSRTSSRRQSTGMRCTDLDFLEALPSMKPAVSVSPLPPLSKGPSLAAIIINITNTWYTYWDQLRRSGMNSFNIDEVKLSLRKKPPEPTQGWVETGFSRMDVRRRNQPVWPVTFWYHKHRIPRAKYNSPPKETGDLSYEEVRWWSSSAPRNPKTPPSYYPIHKQFFPSPFL